MDVGKYTMWLKAQWIAIYFTLQISEGSHEISHELQQRKESLAW